MTSRLQRRVVDIDTLAEFDRTAASARSMNGWRVRHVDLRQRTPVVERLDPIGSLFLGCRLAGAALAHLESGGALVYPDVPDAPVDEYRAALYSPDELYEGLAGQGYPATLDARVYAWSQSGGGPAATADVVAQAVHDSSIGAALDDLLRDTSRRVVGVMGGHGVERTAAGYRDAVVLGHRLGSAGFRVATGGGPGAMEAANLGGYLSRYDIGAVEHAIAAMAGTPSFTPSIGAWAQAAFTVRRDFPNGAPSLGVPTWFYGHEPPNVFADDIAKFFQNSVREATLLERCTGGVVFLAGAAGTVQEVFQDACENYYAAPDMRAPMVLVGREHWTVTVPAWPLLQALATAKGFTDAVALVDDVESAADFITGRTET